MRRQTVVITSRLPEVATEILAPEHDVIAHEATAARRSEEEMIELFAEADAAITLLSDPLTRRVLESNPHLRVIGNYAVGVDNVDLEAARQLGIAITNTPGVLTEATADLTFALILAVTRRVVEGDAVMRRGGFQGWQPLYHLGTGLQGKRLGIIGMGRIGSAVSNRARAFGMEVAYWSRSSSSVGSFDELLATSDVLSIHCPLTPETRHLINRDSLQKMKKSAYIINTARGPIIDESALAEALMNRTIRGAGLDVFEKEPWVDLRLVGLPNVVLLPHLGSATEETRADMARIAATSVQAVLRGAETPNRVA